MHAGGPTLHAVIGRLKVTRRFGIPLPALHPRLGHIMPDHKLFVRKLHRRHTSSSLDPFDEKDHAAACAFVGPAHRIVQCPHAWRQRRDERSDHGDLRVRQRVRTWVGGDADSRAAHG